MRQRWTPTHQPGFLLANSAFFVGMEKKYQSRAVATLINSRGGKALDTFGGVIMVKIRFILGHKILKIVKVYLVPMVVVTGWDI